MKPKRSELPDPKNYDAYIKALLREIEKWTTYYNLPKIEFNTISISGLKTELDRMHECMKGGGRLYAEGIETAFEIINHLVNGVRGVSLVGLTQLSKAEVQAMVAILAPQMIAAHNEQMFVLPCMVTPGEDALVKQFQKRVSEIYRIFQHMNVEKMPSLRYWFDDVKQQFNDNDGEECYAKLFNGYCPIPVMAIRNQSMKILLKSTKICADNGIRFLLLQDECDHSSSENSILDRTLRKEMDEFDSMNQSIYQLYEQQTDTKALQIVRTSATNFDWNYLPGIECVKVKVGKGAIGFNVDPADPAKPYCESGLLTPPTVVSLSELAVDLEINPDLMVANDYQKAVVSKNNSYVNKANRSILNLFSHLLFGNPLGLNNANGCLFRFVLNNDTMKQVAAYLNLHLQNKNVCVIEYYKKDDAKLDPVKDHVENKLKEFVKNRGIKRENVKYIVLATASCRMGQNLPLDCLYGIDLSIANSTQMATILQGVIGRLGGYKAGAYCVMSDLGVSKIRDYAAHAYEGGLHKNIKSVKKQHAQFLTTQTSDVANVTGISIRDVQIEKIASEINTMLSSRKIGDAKKIFQVHFDNLQQLAGNAILVDVEKIVVEKRIKYVNGKDRHGGGKNENAVIVRVNENGRVLSFEWPLLKAVIEKKAKGGLSKKLKIAA